MNKKLIIISIICIVLVLIIFTIYYVVKSKNVWKNTSGNKVDFTLIVKEDKSVGKQKIVSKDIFNGETYDIYIYNAKVKIVIDNKEYDLKDALLNGKATTEDILNKAKSDVENQKANVDMYKDGGTLIYDYNDYRIIKFNSLNGIYDMYIGSRELSYSIGAK